MSNFARRRGHVNETQLTARQFVVRVGGSARLKQVRCKKQQQDQGNMDHQRNHAGDVVLLHVFVFHWPGQQVYFPGGHHVGLDHLQHSGGNHGKLLEPKIVCLGHRIDVYRHHGAGFEHGERQMARQRRSKFHRGHGHAARHQGAIG